MPFLSFAPLAATVASGVLHIAGRVADAVQEKTSDPKTPPAKKSSTPTAPVDATSLANAFAACLAALAHAAPTTPSPAKGSAVTAVNPSAAAMLFPLMLSLPKTAALPASNLPTATMPGKTLPPILTPTAAGTAPTGTAPTGKLIPVSATTPAVPTLPTGKAVGETAPTLTTAKTSELPALGSAGKPASALLRTPNSELKTTDAEHPLIPVSNTVPAEDNSSEPPADGTVSSNAASPTANTTAALTPTDHIVAVASGMRTAPTLLPTVAEHTTAVSSTAAMSVLAAARTSQSPGVVAAEGPQSNNRTSAAPPANAPPPVPQTPLVPASMAAPVTATASIGRSATPAAPLAEQLTQAVVAHADTVTRDGRTDFHLRLDPPQLGSVQIHLTATEQTVSARIVVAHEATRQLLEGHAHHLRQGLAEAGLTLGHFDVTHDSGGWAGGQHTPPEFPTPSTSAAPLAALPRTAAVVSVNRTTDGIDLLA